MIALANYLGSEYVPSQAKLVELSGFPVALQVPLAFIPLNFPVPLVACHFATDKSFTSAGEQIMPVAPQKEGIDNCLQPQTDPQD